MSLNENLRRLRMLSDRIGSAGLLAKAQLVEELAYEIVDVLHEISERIGKLEGESNGEK